jgi:hypothetical protein
MRIVIAMFIGLLAGCAAGPTLGTRFTESPEQLEGHAKVYLYRPAYMGMVWYPKVYVNGQEIVHLPAGGYTYFFLPPGEYELRGVQADVFQDAGKEYHARLSVAGTTDHYLKFHFSKTGSKANVFIVGNNAVPYSEAQGSFVFEPIRDRTAALAEMAQYRFVAPIRKTLE